MIVEDSALIAIDIETLLDELGAARIVTAGRGERASPTSGSGDRFDLAIIDIRTAGFMSDGFIEEFDRLDVPVILLSTETEANGARPVEGTRAIVVKPFTYEDICAAIARLVA